MGVASTSAMMISVETAITALFFAPIFAAFVYMIGGFIAFKLLKFRG